MIQPLRARTNAAVPLPLKPTNTINDQIANLKLSRHISEQENGLNFRSKIPVFKSRISGAVVAAGGGCGGGGGVGGIQQKRMVSSLLPSASCTDKIEQKQQQQQPKRQEPVKPKIENIDNESNCFLLSDYAPDIYQYLHQLEVELDFFSLTNFN